MSFLVAHHYLIEPTTQLITKLNSELEPSWAALLLERIVVSKSHADSQNVEAQPQSIARLKIAFLARLMVDRVWDTPTQFADLFGGSELSTALFDRWWTLSEIELEWFSDWEGFIEQAQEQVNNTKSE
jgi:hypothetical protein